MPYLSAELTFGFNSSSSGEKFDITIPTSEFNLGPFDNNSTLCQALINVWLPGQDLPPLLGASLMKHYYTVWNTGNQSLGFAAICMYFKIVELTLSFELTRIASCVC
jgi:hypothetical protein